MNLLFMVDLYSAGGEFNDRGQKILPENVFTIGPIITNWIEALAKWQLSLWHTCI